MIDWKDCCTIGITTRDRPEVLSHTIDRLKVIGLEDLRYIIIDDGSEDPTATTEIVRSLSRCRFVRHSVSNGLVRRRQDMATICETPFLISLDDDSYFTDLTGMPHAFDEFQKDPQLALLSFGIIQLKPHERRQTLFPAGELWWFRGCGYLLRISSFLNVGGYPSVFQYGGEETHLMMQLFRAGYKMLHCPHVIVEHRWSEGMRDPKKMEYHFTRGQVLVKLLNEPILIALAGIILLLLKRLLNGPSHATSHLQGWLSGIKAGIPAWMRFRHLTWRQYWKLRAKLFTNRFPEKVDSVDP